MRVIPFSYNWNKKLDCDAFTTIRIYQPEKYVIDETYQIDLNKAEFCKGTIIDIKKFWLKDLNDFIAYLDTGYDKEECKKIITLMYKRVDFNTTPLSLILIRKQK
jgi:hypothetical protein